MFPTCRIKNDLETKLPSGISEPRPKTSMLNKNDLEIKLPSGISEPRPDSQHVE
jgi:hypothetical protein